MSDRGLNGRNAHVAGKGAVYRLSDPATTEPPGPGVGAGKLRGRSQNGKHLAQLVDDLVDVLLLGD